LGTISSDKEKVKSMNAVFSMNSMEMGLNKFQFKQGFHSKEDDWQSLILLPICTSKRTDWIMIINLETENKIYRAQVPLQIK